MHRYRLVLTRHRRLIWALAALLILGVGLALWNAYRPRVLVHDFDSCIAAGYDASNTDPQTCTDGHHTYVIAASSAPVTASTGPSGVQQSFQLLVTGDSRGDYPRRAQVITTQVAWVAFWNQVHAKLVPKPVLLPVDFSKQEVIAITEGVEPTSGYSLEFLGVLAGAASAVVTYEEIVPSAKCKLTPTPTSLYLLVATDKTVGPVTFTPTVNPRKC